MLAPPGRPATEPKFSGSAVTTQLLEMVALTMKANWSASVVPHVVGGAFVLDVSVIEVWMPAKLS